jgi:zinc D-Ala-D-Ala carboxypeptidase
MKISKNFTVGEFLESQAGRRHRIEEQFNPPREALINLKLLVENILQPLRDAIGPIHVSSGYRCPRVNKIVGGASKSQHILGQAADLKGIRVSNKKLYETILKMKLPFDQLIWEYGTDDEPAWVHVSYRINPRGQVLKVG